MNVRQIIHVLKANGWQEIRQTGSHKIFKKEGELNHISVPYHNNKDMPSGTLKNILKNAKIDM